MTRVALSLLLMMGAWSFALPRALAEEERVEGKVVKAGDGKLEIVNKSGENEVFEVSPKAVIKRNDKVAVLEDLQADDVVIVKFQRKGDKGVALTIFANSPE